MKPTASKSADGGRHVDRSAGRATSVTGAAGHPVPAAPPPGYRDWPCLAATAAQLLADREAGDPRLVASHKLTASQAEYRLTTARALALQWRAVIEHRDATVERYFDDFGAYPAAVRIEIADIARAAAERARAAPGDEARALLAGACAALAWWQQRDRDGDDTPRILRVHAANQHARATRAPRPVPAPAPLPVRPPMRAAQPQRAML